MWTNCADADAVQDSRYAAAGEWRVRSGRRACRLQVALRGVVHEMSVCQAAQFPWLQRWPYACGAAVARKCRVSADTGKCCDAMDTESVDMLPHQVMQHCH